jgi:hypothetical protein
MNPQLSKNGTSGRRAEAADTPAPKIETDGKMAGHFNEIVFGILAALAIGVLIASWMLHHRSEKVVPRVNQKNSAQQLKAPTFNKSQRADSRVTGSSWGET